MNKLSDVTPVPEDPESMQEYIQDRRVIGVSTLSLLITSTLYFCSGNPKRSRPLPLHVRTRVARASSVGRQVEVGYNYWGTGYWRSLQGVA